MKTSLLIFILLLPFHLLLGQGFDCEDISRTSTQSTRDDIYEMVGMLKEFYSSGKVSRGDLDNFKDDYIGLRSEFNTFYSKVKDDISSGYLFTGENVICRAYKNEIVDLENGATVYLRDLSRYVNAVRHGFQGSTLSSGTPLGSAGAIFAVAGLLLWTAEQGASVKADTFYKKVYWKSWADINP